MVLESMYNINLNISNYHLLALNDIVRMFIIQVISQSLFYLRNGNIELFSTVFIENTLFILLGVFIYWIVFNNVLVFTNKDKEHNKLDNYYQNVYTL